MDKHSKVVQPKATQHGQPSVHQQVNTDLDSLDRERHSTRHNVTLYCWVLGLTFGMLLAVFVARDIYPIGDKVLRFTDGDQYFGVLGYLQSALYSGNDLLYSWSSVLGGNLIPILAYYSGSPFNLLSVLFPDNLMLAYHIILIMKFLAAAVCFALMLDQIFPCVEIKYKVLFASSYPFIGYMTYFIWNQSWMDGVIILPLIALGIWLILQQKKPLLYIIVLAIMLISNYYVAYMICIASALLFVAGAVIVFPKWNREVMIALGWFATATVVAAALAAFLLIPTYLALPDNRMETFGDLWKTATYRMGPEEILSMLFTASTSNMNFSNNYPVIFTGIVQFTLAVTFFFNKDISRRAKAAAGIILIFILLSFMISTLNVVWHGFSKNVWFNYRYSFIVSFLLELIAFVSYIHLSGLNGVPFVAGTVIAAITAFALGTEMQNIQANILMLDAACIIIETAKTISSWP